MTNTFVIWGKYTNFVILTNTFSNFNKWINVRIYGLVKFVLIAIAMIPIVTSVKGFRNTIWDTLKVDNFNPFRLFVREVEIGNNESTRLSLEGGTLLWEWMDELTRNHHRLSFKISKDKKIKWTKFNRFVYSAPPAFLVFLLSKFCPTSIALSAKTWNWFEA